MPAFISRRNISAALLTAAVIGTVLNVINSYDVFAEGRFTGRNVIRVTLTYITPFCVSLYSSVQTERRIAIKSSNKETIRVI